MRYRVLAGLGLAYLAALPAPYAEGVVGLNILEIRSSTSVFRALVHLLRHGKIRLIGHALMALFRISSIWRKTVRIPDWCMSL